VKYALFFGDNTLILMSESTPLLKSLKNGEYSLMITVINIALQISE